MDIKDLVHDIGSYADASGWSDRFDKLKESGDEDGLRDHVLSKLALVDSEVAEAIEEIRDGKGYNETYYTHDGDEVPFTEIRGGVTVMENTHTSLKPEGVPSELADVIIRVLHLCWLLEIDIEEILEEKLAYNKTRGVRHGGKMA